jgi:hypothetical protein
MESIKQLLRRISLQILFIIFCNISTSAQYYYVNSYSSADSEGLNNVVYKIDIDSKRIVDNLILGAKGQYVNDRPYFINTSFQNEFLLTLLVNGAPAKNANGGNNITTHYYIIDKQNFVAVRQDSLPGIMVSKIDKIDRDTILLSILDNQAGWMKARYVYNNRFNRLQFIDRHPFDAGHQAYPVIGGHVDPDSICKIGEISFYHGIIDDGQILLFSANNPNNIIDRLIIGDIGREAVIVGCNSLDSILYAINLKYKFMSSFPPDTSDDTVYNRIIRINANNFSIIDTITLNPGEAYFSNENGTADIIGNYLIYYFSKSDGYKRFDPAYMLIFDTRTNEATWLRVGWR